MRIEWKETGGVVDHDEDLVSSYLYVLASHH